MTSDVHTTHKGVFEAILEDALAGYWDWDLRDNSEYLSPTFKKMFGYEDHEMANSPESWQRIIFQEDLPPIFECFEAHVKSRGKIPFSCEARYQHKNGSTVWVLCTGRVVEWSSDWEPLRMVGCHIDISKQKRVEENLKISETRFKGAFEHSAIGMALVSVDGKWLKVNRRVCELLGYSKEELLKTTFQDITHPEDLDLDLQNVSQMLEGKIETYQMEKRYFHKEGYIIWVLLSVSLVRDTKGRPMHFVSQIEDITQRKKAEQEQRELNNRLQDQNQRLSDFAQITSHNLRAPVSNLSSLLMMCEALEHNPEEKKELFSKFETVVEHLSGTLNDLIYTLRVTANPDVHKENLDLKHMLTRAEEMLAGDIMTSKAVITSDFSEASHVAYNPAYLESILLNLISNSIRFRSPDRIPQIEIRSWVEEGETKLSVTDNGLGIDMKRQGHKLFGLHKTFHRHEEARGVGLFMTKAHIESQGGSIKAHSEVDKGSTFTVTFGEA